MKILRIYCCVFILNSCSYSLDKNITIEIKPIGSICYSINDDSLIINEISVNIINYSSNTYFIPMDTIEKYYYFKFSDNLHQDLDRHYNSNPLIVIEDSLNKAVQSFPSLGFPDDSVVKEEIILSNEELMINQLNNGIIIPKFDSVKFRFKFSIPGKTNGVNIRYNLNSNNSYYFRIVFNENLYKLPKNIRKQVKNKINSDYKLIDRFIISNKLKLRYIGSDKSNKSIEYRPDD